MALDTQEIIELPTIEIIQTPYFYKQLNRNNKLLTYDEENPQLYKLYLLMENTPIQYEDDYHNVVYGKDDDGNEIAELTKDNLDKITKDSVTFEKLLYYKDKDNKEQLSDSHNVYLRCPAIFDDTIIKDNNGNVTTDRRGLLKLGLDYVNEVRYDNNNNPFRIQGYCKFDNQYSINSYFKQFSKNAKIQKDGDYDAYFNIRGWIITDATNDFILFYGLYDTPVEVSHELIVDSNSFKEWFDIGLSCKVN